MAFSSSTDFSYTRDQIIKAALRKCRAIDAEHESAEAYQTKQGAEGLNILLKSLQQEGVLLWVQQNVEVNLVKGKRSYTIGPSGNVNIARPLRVFNPFRRNISTKNDVPLNQYSKSDYAALTNKFTTGTPSAIYYSRQITLGELYVWPVPDTSTEKVVLTAEVQLQDFDASGDTAHMPPYAYEYFIWALAAYLSSDYGLPLQERAYFEQKAEVKKQDLLQFEEEEDGVQFIPAHSVYQK